MTPLCHARSGPASSTAPPLRHRWTQLAVRPPSRRSCRPLSSLVNVHPDSSHRHSLRRNRDNQACGAISHAAIRGRERSSHVCGATRGRGRARTSEMPDYWAALDLERGAGPEAVKAAYRRLQKVYHPDSPQVHSLPHHPATPPLPVDPCGNGTRPVAVTTASQL